MRSSPRGAAPPGMDEKDIEVTVRDGTLMIRDERKEEKEEKKEDDY